jgi:hypothetical protein
MAGLIDRFRDVVRAVLKLPEDPGEPPDLMRLGLYRARVDVCATDGSTVDLTPEDKRISPEKGVPMRVGIPGATTVVQPGAIVLLGWERGDPSRPYAVPSWESGATVTKLVLKATTVYLGDESGAEPLMRKSDFDNHVHPFGGLLCSNGTISGSTGGAPAATGTALVRGK